MNVFKKSVLYSSASQFGNQFINFFSILIIARLLSPEEIGVFAVVTAISMIAIEIRTFGVGQYLIREKNLSQAIISASLGLLLLLSWGLGILLILTASNIADYYNESDIRFLVVLVSIGFFFSPFSAITQAVLVRNMQFGKILVIRLTTTLSFAIVAILLAFNGESYFSLGYATLVSSIINFALHLYYKDSSYSWLPSFTGLARQFHFGIYVSLSSISNRITYNIPDLIIGKVASMTDVGIFSRGFGFINFANAILTDGVKQVVLPHLSELRRGGKNYREAYLNIVSLYSGISVPCFAAINAMSYPVIITLFGDQWAAAAPISSILAIWGGVVSIHAFYGPLLINVGKEKLLMITDVGMLLIRIASIVLSSEYGLEAIAWSLMATGVVELFVKFIMVSVYVDIPVFQAVRNVAKSLCVALVLWSYLTFAGYYLDLNNVLPQVSFFILGFSGFIIWVGALFLCKHGLTIHIKSGVAKLI